MNPEQELITQMGLLLTQLRFARHALENIDRATASYAGISVSLTGGGAAALGAPPLQNGALRVYITNISELTSGGGGGLGSFIEGLFGGIGRFVGGFLGGLAGGTVGAIAFPYDLYLLDHMVSTLERIVRALGIGAGGAPAGAGANARAATSASQPTSDAQIDRFTAAVRDLTGLFGAASSAPEGGESSLTESGRVWLGVFRELTSVINGMILLVPLLMGALASFLLRLTDIKAAIVNMLAFIVENVLVLRGVVLVTVFDTIAAGGQLAGNVLTIVAGAIDSILGSILTVIGSALQVAIGAIRLLGAGLAATVDGLMRWLRDGLGNFLIFLGNTRIFRLIIHMVDVLPLILPALLRLLDRDVTSNAAQADLRRLQRAASIPFPGAGVSGGPAGTVAAFPDIGALALPQARVDAFQRTLDDAGHTLRTQTSRALDSASGALRDIGAYGRRALAGDATFERDLEDQRGRVAGQARALAEALRPAQDAFATRPRTGLEAIATAYEGWLRGGGMATLMERITDQLQRTPTSGPEAERSLLGRIVDAVAGDRPRATVEIGEVVVEVGGPAAGGPVSAIEGAPGAHGAVAAVVEWMRDVRERGGSIDDPASAPITFDTAGAPA